MVGPNPKKRQRTIVVLLGFVAGLAALLLLISNLTTGLSDPLFRGKPESEWIKNLKYCDHDQVREWRSFGEEGVPVLVRGLERAYRNGAIERIYRQAYCRIPRFLW